jgi:hypothetical protein
MVIKWAIIKCFCENGNDRLLIMVSVILFPHNHEKLLKYSETRKWELLNFIYELCCQDLSPHKKKGKWNRQQAKEKFFKTNF